MKPITIFTDGSSRGNPGPGGWGTVILVAEDERVIEVGGYEEKTTNNRMELQAVIGALLAIRQFPGDVSVHTDSGYLISGITKWVHGWIKNGWITSTKEEVQNRDLWELITSLLYEREQKGKVSWKHVSGHAGVPGNERCDEIATAFADKKEIELFDGALADYSVDLHSKIPDNVKKGIKDEKRTRSKQKAFSYLSLVDGKLEKHKTWAECEARVKGKKGARFKKSLSHKDEQKIIAEWNA